MVPSNMKQNPQTKLIRRKLLFILFIVGILCSGLGASLYFIMPAIVEDRIRSEMRLISGTQIYDKWVDTNVPTQVKIYFFEVLNPKEVIKGKKIVVRERGPYSFM